MLKNVDIPVFLTGKVTSRLIIASAIAGLAMLSPQAKAEVEYIPDPSSIVTNDFFTLGAPTTTKPSGSYVVLSAVDKATNPWTVTDGYSAFSLNKTSYIYGNGSHDLSPVNVNVPNTDTPVALTVKYETSEARIEDIMTSNISGKVFAELPASSTVAYGGAIYNSGNGNYSITNTAFLKNSSTSRGGAIYNVTGAQIGDITNSTFINNSSEYGGSIMNWSIIGDITNTTFISNNATHAGAIYNNTNTIGNIKNCIFISNSADSAGAAGVIYNYFGQIGDIVNSTFISNSAKLGGVTYNNNATIGNIINSTFISNMANNGGVIYNFAGAQVGNITNSTFINNLATLTSGGYGGVIYNPSGAQIGNITNSTFISNSAKNGGVIFGRGIIGNITNSTFISNRANAYGGAIILASGNIGDIINSTFINNRANEYSGAIYANSGSINSIQSSTFVTNHAKSGGAVVVWGNDGSGYINEIKDSVFISNSAEETGGAIYHEDDIAVIGNIQNSTFLNNTAGTHGGAIYALNDVNITSDGGTTLFQGNTDSTGSNAIYMDNAAKTVTFDHKNGGKTYMYDTIDGASGYTVDIKGDGTMYLFNDINNANVSIGGVELNTINNNIHTYNFDTLNLTDDFNMAVDVDLANAKMDRLAAETVSGTGKINVVGMNIVKDSTKKSTSVFFADNNLKDKVVNNVTEVGSGTDNPYQTTAYSPIFKYNVSYNQEETGGYYNFNTDGYNPSVLAAPVAAQLGGMASQWNSYDQAFINMDMNMLYTREARRAMKLQNKYAMADLNSAPLAGEVAHSAEGGLNPSPEFVSSQRSLTNSILSRKGRGNAIDNRLVYDSQTPMVYSNTYLPEKDLAAWARPYTSFETVHLRKGPHVNNTMYGMYFGGDSEMYELKHNWDFQYSVYAGYNGSRQSYKDVTILQNGGTLGATGIFYHGDFFTGLTVNAGAGSANADTMYGHEDFAMLMTGVASKTGYNWELLKGRFIIQPSWLMSYSFVNTFDYTNAAGVKISSDPLHAIQLAPQLKFIGNLPKGWQPYASVQMVWNIMDESKFKANDVSLPNMSMGPFIQYGVGVQKRWGERFTGFFQTMFRNGSRTGVAFTLGFRWALGKDRPKTSHSSTRTVIK